jgi:hypothetical protein
MKACDNRKDGQRRNSGTVPHTAGASFGQAVVVTVVDGMTDSMAGGIFQRQGKSKDSSIAHSLRSDEGSCMLPWELIRRRRSG